MVGRHIAMITNLGHGHVYPALALCRELVKRGYRVTYPSNDSYAREIHSAGAEPIIFKAMKFEAMSAFMDFCKLPEPQWWIMTTTTLWPWFLIDAAVAVPQLLEAYREDRPDLILYDRFAFAGRILATRLGCPAVLTYPHFAYYKKYFYRRNGVCVNPEPVIHFGRTLDMFLSAYGIKESDNLWHTEALNIYFIPKEFQYHADSFDDRSLFIGPCLGRPITPMWKSKANGKPIVLVYDMSSCSDVDYFRNFVEPLSGLKCHVILSLGQQVQKDALKGLPANFEINQYASHVEILPHATLSLGRPGMGATLEALYYGVPVIALPLYSSHDEIAFRLTELEVGVTLPREPPQGLIREVVDKALEDTALRDRAMSMGEQLRHCGGAPMAVDRIEEFLAGHR